MARLLTRWWFKTKDQYICKISKSSYILLFDYGLWAFPSNPISQVRTYIRSCSQSSDVTRSSCWWATTSPCQLGKADIIRLESTWILAHSTFGDINSRLMVARRQLTNPWMTYSITSRPQTLSWRTEVSISKTKMSRRIASVGVLNFIWLRRIHHG